MKLSWLRRVFALGLREGRCERGTGLAAEELTQVAAVRDMNPAAMAE
ncbi:hypothetical protein OG609_19265 [Streptomyces sp. NBC_01224]|nr:hypothetical protein OG609_19265 [Streptomyces sp. NBC_01224]